MGNKIYCHSLTIADSKSRFLLTAKGHYHENLKSAKAEFKRVFRTYGVPQQMHTDNGSPFGSVRAIQRFTQLSYWFIELGVKPVFLDPSNNRMKAELSQAKSILFGESLNLYVTKVAV